MEEGILELDRLGDLGKVDDTLALMTAARFCDLDTRSREEMLRLLLTIDDQVPANLLYPYGVAAALVALFLRDEKIRSRALAALRGLPAAAVESDKNIQSYLAALHDKEWDKQVD